MVKKKEKEKKSTHFLEITQSRNCADVGNGSKFNFPGLMS